MHMFSIQPPDDIDELIWTTSGIMAVYFMKKPELMYAIYNDIGILELSEWAEAHLKIIEEVYNNAE